ncbi:MAG: hypothetical protein ACO1TE_05935 [Prosthecobacter sp.]
MNRAFLFFLLAAVLGTSLNAADKIVPAGTQYKDLTIENEPYDPEHIPARLREIDQKCVHRLLTNDERDYKYLGSLGSRGPLSDETLLQLMRMVDIKDKDQIVLPGKLARAWASPAANVLIADGERAKPAILKQLPNFVGKPQHVVLVQVLEEIEQEKRDREAAERKKAER